MRSSPRQSQPTQAETADAQQFAPAQVRGQRESMIESMAEVLLRVNGFEPYPGANDPALWNGWALISMLELGIEQLFS